MSKAYNEFTRNNLWLQLLLTATLVATPQVLAKKHAAVANSFPYLYATRTNSNASFPVVEYFAPTGNKNLDANKPAFLYDEHQGYRIVNFYAHWRSTCKNFKPHFVQFAQRVQQLAAQQNETVSVYGVSCHPNRRLCRKQTTQGYAVVRLLAPGQTVGIDIKHTDVNPVKVLQKMGMHLDLKDYEDAVKDVVDYTEDSQGTHQWQQMIESFLGKPTQKKIPHYRRTREELKADIHLSFDFAMRDGIFTSDDPLTDKARKALKDWLTLLHKTLPEAWEMHKVLDQLIRDFDYVSKHEAYMHGILDQFPPEKSGWSFACSHGDPNDGYTCGLWQLFHAMTVGVVDYNGMVHETKRIATEDAAHTLRDYLENFFRCIDCRDHFLATYNSCAYDRCNRLKTDAKGVAKEEQKSWAQLPLWLFEVHNGVNLRLMKEKAERDKREPTLQDEIDVLWPPKRDCLPCWNADSEDGKMSWNRTNVYKWLVVEYGHLDANAGNLKKELRALTAEAKNEKRKKRRIEIASGTALVAFCAVVVLGAKVRRRRATGRHKKVEDDSEHHHH
jgi:Erv1 / Alr family/Thioredoxin